MIGFLKKRKQKKQIKEYFQAARHARNMREDIADPEKLQAISEAEKAVLESLEKNSEELEKALKSLEKAVDEVYPYKLRTGIRENVEVIIVALAAAMAIRAFFFQPFKIPTGSMQPTLNGITTQYQEKSNWTDKQPVKFVKWLFTGESYKEVRAKVSGATGERLHVAGDKLVIEIGGVPHKIPEYMLKQLEMTPEKVKPGNVVFRGQGDLVLVFKPYYEKGDRIAGAQVIAGDHILVNKMAYNFRRPKRGDISVFDTRHIENPHVRKDSFYIKRMVGLPGEKIQIKDKEIIADGKVVRQPPIFEKIATDPAYDGHTNEGMLSSPEDFIQLSDTEYLMMGDNTKNSLDGRFFGGVLREDFQGPAFFVYWPFRSHWGTIH